MSNWQNAIWNWGALFVAVGVDTTLLARAAEALAARFGAQATAVKPGVY